MRKQNLIIWQGNFFRFYWGGSKNEKQALETPFNIVSIFAIFTNHWNMSRTNFKFWFVFIHIELFHIFQLTGTNFDVLWINFMWVWEQHKVVNRCKYRWYTVDHCFLRFYKYEECGVPLYPIIICLAFILQSCKSFGVGIYQLCTSW